MALIMVPKILFIRKHAHDPREKEDDEKDTAELELKYREILRENENFQKKISEVSGMMMYIIHRFTCSESFHLTSMLISLLVCSQIQFFTKTSVVNFLQIFHTIFYPAQRR